MQFYFFQSCTFVSENAQCLLLEKISFLFEPRAWKFPGKTFNPGITVRKRNVTNAFRGGSDEDIAEERFGVTVVYSKVFPAVLVFTRRHTFYSDKKVVEPARTGQSGFKTDRFQIIIFFKELLRVFNGGELEKFFRTYAGPFPEHSLKMKRTHMDFPGHVFQTRLILKIFPDKPDGFFDALIILHIQN
jgi:hypothetical protein